MSLWKSNGSVTTSYAKTTVLANVPGSNNINLINNTTPGAFVKNQVVGVYPVTANLVNVSVTKGNKDTTAGYILRRSGMGPVVSLAFSNTGLGYSNNDLVKVVGVGCTNAVGNVSTNATGGVVNVVFTTAGLFPNSSYVTLSITNSTSGTPNGTNFAATVVLGGRAGRHLNEPLVAYGSLYVNSTANVSAFPNA